MSLGPNSHPSGAPGSTPRQETAASIAVEKFIPREDLFEGLDDLFDQEKVARVVEKAVQKVLRVIPSLMADIDYAAPQYRSKIAGFAAENGVDFNQMAAEYLVQEMFFLQMATHLGLEKGFVYQNAPQGAYALTASHSFVAISPSCGLVEGSEDLARTETTYTPMPSRTVGGEGSVLRPVKYENQPIASIVAAGRPCIISPKGMCTSPLKMVFVIPSDFPIEAFVGGTNAVNTATASSTGAMRLPAAEAQERAARQALAHYRAAQGSRTSMADIGAHRRSAGLPPAIGEDVLKSLREAGVLDPEADLGRQEVVPTPPKVERVDFQATVFRWLRKAGIMEDNGQ
jgi:hypothetical protein